MRSGSPTALYVPTTCRVVYSDNIVTSHDVRRHVSVVVKTTTRTWLISQAHALTLFHTSRMRQAIEGFALMVKKTAQTLQSFGTELAETELPNEIQATTILLSTHTDKKNKMKVNKFPWMPPYVTL